MSQEQVHHPESLDALCDAALHHFGVPSQLNKTTQECAELIVAITNFNEYRANAKEEVISEIADVTIMARQLRLVFGAEAVDAEIQRKLRRMKDRIRAERKDDGQPQPTTIGKHSHTGIG